MLKVTVQDNPISTHLRIEGKLVSPWLTTLENCWRNTQSTATARILVADLTEVHSVDAAGRYLLCWMHATGVRFIASTPAMQKLVDDITAVPASAVRPPRQRTSHKLVGWFLSVI